MAAEAAADRADAFFAVQDYSDHGNRVLARRMAAAMADRLRGR